MKVAVWVLRVVVGTVFIGAGAAKLFLQPEQAAEQFAAFGYAPWFAVFVGLCELAGGIGVLLPKVSALAAAGLGAVVLGAAATHLRHDPVSAAVPALVLLALCALLVWLQRGSLVAWRDA